MKFRGKNSSDQDLEYSKLFLKVDSPMKAKALGNQKPLIRFMTKLVLNKNNDQRKINDLIQEYKNKVKIRDDWEKVKFHVMTEGIINKFAQYKDLKKQLKEIPDNMLLVEHSKRDKVWSDGGDGGTGEKGTNYMGKILTALSWIIKY
jgi:ribA/ribD-fused uncharacterized protein